jgi:hypothetical protein
MTSIDSSSSEDCHGSFDGGAGGAGCGGVGGVAWAAS